MAIVTTSAHYFTVTELPFVRQANIEHIKLKHKNREGENLALYGKFLKTLVRFNNRAYLMTNWSRFPLVFPLFLQDFTITTQAI